MMRYAILAVALPFLFILLPTTSSAQGCSWYYDFENPYVPEQDVHKMVTSPPHWYVNCEASGETSHDCLSGDEPFVGWLGTCVGVHSFCGVDDDDLASLTTADDVGRAQAWALVAEYPQHVAWSSDWRKLVLRDCQGHILKQIHVAAPNALTPA